MWRRLVKHSFSIGLGQGVNLLQQLLLPVAFLREYGAADYGSWLVVMAAAGQLGNLDFGLQTYLTNRLIMLHEAGDFSGFRRIQSIGLRMVLGMAGGGVAGLLTVQWLPIERWLKLDWAGSEARQVVLLLGAWVILRLVQGQLSAVLRATGQAHRAQHWENLQRVLLLVSCLLLLHWRSGFRWLAVAHVGCVLLGIALVLWDARRSPVFPTLHEWDAREARQMVRPSLFFGLTTLNFLVLYEAPLLILQWTLGPVAVVTFATTRTLFSAARQLLTPVQLAVQQELPRALNAEPGQLRQLYRFSESVALVGGCVLITGFALVSPWLIQHWLHGRVEPSLPLLALMACVTLATILKDNRNNLPLATNCHERSTLLVGGGNILMAVLGFGLAQAWGEPGLLAAWLVTELALATLLQRQNFAQFGWGHAPSPLVPVGLTLGIGVTVFYALTWSQGVPLFAQMACAVLLAALSGVVALGLLGEGIVKPTQRALMALNLCRQEG